MKSIFLILAIACLSCSSNNHKSIKTKDGLLAKGDVDEQSRFQGLIKFYEPNSHKLVSEAIYKDDRQEGESKFFYPNGKVKVWNEYRDGQAHGFTKHYNEQGELAFEQYFYYGLRVGPSVHFKNNQPQTYTFWSLDKEELFSLNYDSIGTKAINEVNKEFFFFTIKPLELIDNKASKSGRECFLYLPNPPKYTFSYSLCIVNEQYDVLETIRTFDPVQPWNTFLLDTSLTKKGQFLALRLKIDDQVNNADASAFKKL